MLVIAHTHLHLKPENVGALLKNQKIERGPQTLNF